MIFLVKSNLKHNGKSYKRGDEIELNNDFSEPLLRDGVIISTDEAKEEKLKESDPKPVQPPVNDVKREGDDVDGDVKIEEGKVDAETIISPSETQEEADEGDDVDNTDSTDSTDSEDETEETQEEKKEGTGDEL